MSKGWSISDLSLEQETTAQSISEALGLSLVFARLLTRRGITSIEQAEAYLYPKLSGLPNAFLMKDMETAVSTLRYHIKSRRPIMITGDHDVDGVTSVALIHNVLRDLFDCEGRLHYHIPNGDDIGYGISRNCIDWAKAQGCELIIAIDTGIKAIDAVSYARREGIDVIICDHHEPDPELPKANAILNPKQADCPYPNPHLSGCGVGYKLMQALLEREGIAPERLHSYLDLLAVSTAADLVPLIGENRAYLVHGLRELASAPSVGIKALLQQVQVYPGEAVDISTIIYKIAPRINAAGRMQNGQLAVDLLTATSVDYAYKVCQKLEVYNEERRLLDLRMTEEAEAQVQTLGDLSEQPILLLYHPDWHVGVMGIVAARMAERYKRPTLVLTKEGKDIVASGRSSRPINIYAAIESCRDLLKNFGGHKYAAGLTTTEDCLQELYLRIRTYIRQNNHCPDNEQAIEVDAHLPIEEITPELEQELQLMAPFGLRNERPLFVTERMRDAGGSKVVGRDGQHLRLRMTDRYCRRKPITAIALGQSEYAKWVLSQQAFSICYTFEPAKYKTEGVHLNVKKIFTN